MRVARCMLHVCSLLPGGSTSVWLLPCPGHGMTQRTAQPDQKFSGLVCVSQPCRAPSPLLSGTGTPSETYWFMPLVLWPVNDLSGKGQMNHYPLLNLPKYVIAGVKERFCA